MPHFPAWIVYFANLGLRSWSLLWSWTGMGWAAAAVSVLLFIAEIHRQAKISYQQRYTELSPAAVLDSLRQSLSPTLRRYKTKIAVRAWICFYLIAAGRVIWTDRSESTQTIAALRAKNQELEQSLQLRYHEVSPAVNTANPDESNRARALRDHHFELLRPVLRNESSQLKGVADQIKNTGHVSAMIERQAKTVPADLIWPDIMSQDLRNHFPDYDNKKRELRTQVEAQDREFQLTMSRLEDQKPVTDLEPYWKEMLAFAFVERSLGHGDVMKLRVSEGGYNFESPRGTIGGSGQPPVDIVAAVRVFDSINADANLAPHIASMKRREEVIVNAAQDLSKQAAFLAEGVVLPGMCSFLKKVD